LKEAAAQDEKIALLAAQIAFDRGVGKPEVSAEVDVNHAFVIAPQSNMPIDEWLATKGQGWTAHQKELQAQRAKTEGPAIDLKANGEQPELESPPTPPVDPSKLN
jgi:hypothetical protein